MMLYSLLSFRGGRNIVIICIISELFINLPG